MQQLRKDLQTEFCMCCGRRNTEIMGYLLEQPLIDGKRKWEMHTLHEGHDYFYDANTVNFCVKCGHLLKDEDVHGSHEFMGMYGSARASQFIVEGYKCSHCGFEDKF